MNGSTLKPVYETVAVLKSLVELSKSGVLIAKHRSLNAITLGAAFHNIIQADSYASPDLEIACHHARDS
jgi:hypothetical protein